MSSHKVPTDYLVFLKGASKTYHCEQCAMWLPGVGNWGGCTAVHPAPHEVDGLHIHRQSSCKYWMVPESGVMASADDTNPQRFSKGESLYGAMEGFDASPEGFACKRCRHWQPQAEGCDRFAGAVIEADDCSDGWSPNEATAKRIADSPDQSPPTSVEHAHQLAEMYAPPLGEVLERAALSGDAIDRLGMILKSGDGYSLERLYRSAAGEMVPAVIVDIDGTLADTRHRDCFKQQKDWDGYFARVHDDGVMMETVDRVKAHKGEGRMILLMTGRPEKLRVATMNWLDVHGIPYDALYMRPNDDRRPGFAVKEDLYTRHLLDHYQVVCVMDNDPQIIEMFTLRNIPTEYPRDEGGLA